MILLVLLFPSNLEFTCMIPINCVCACVAIESDAVLHVIPRNQNYKIYSNSVKSSLKPWFEYNSDLKMTIYRAVEFSRPRFFESRLALTHD